MNFFLNGEFKIGESWENKPPSRASNSREKSRGKVSNKSLVNAGKNIISQPSHDILDDQVTRHILKQFAAQIPPPPSIRSQKKISPKDQNLMRYPPKQKNSLPQAENDLLTSMASRLKTVQLTLKNQRQEMKEKNITIDKLKSENIFLKGFRQDSTRQYQKLKKLQQQNDELKKKVIEMETYLKKYGIKWVGDKLEGKLQIENMKKAIAKGNYQYRLPKQIDINTMIRRIEQLNAGLHSQGQGTQIYQQNGVHKFRKSEPMPIGFFANGIAIKGYKFFSYQSKQSLQILGDLIDGYFPYVLKAKYPNGIFLKVVDKLAQRYNEESSQESIHSLESKQKNQFKPPSKEEFLQKLPKSIMKNGKVVQIRDQIEKRMNGECNNTIKQQLSDQQNEYFEKIDGLTIFKTVEQSKLDSKQIGNEDVCTFKIRNEQGEVCILNLSKQKKINDVYLWMSKIVKGNFRVFSNFPRRSYERSLQQNLEQLGFYPNAMLHIQNQPK